MMLPILISVSVTPVSYFFCAVAGAEAAAMINQQSASVLNCVLKNGVLKNCLARRFMSFPPRAAGQRDSFSCRTVSLGHAVVGLTIAGAQVGRKRRAAQRRFVAEVLRCGAANACGLGNGRPA